ncbi:MAG: hypothetical protein NWP98_05060, partial [Erythrobacter sp.]|nr:hypothetical protein [Erythrobacter sp.]
VPCIAGLEKGTAMIAKTRRALLLALIGVGVSGGATSVLRSLTAPLSAAPTLPLRLPEAALRLERVLERGIGDAAAITVRRSWMVRYQRLGRGIVINGEQIGAEVTAPPHLATLAQIEQQRDTSAMFPLMLAEDGTILSSDLTPPSDVAVTDALQAAEAMIAGQSLPADERERYRLYLAQVHQAGATALDTLPADLLFPTGKPVDMSRSVALPGGLNGQFTLHYSAEPQADAPWLKHAEREVITTVAGLTRRALEVWTLSPV